MGVGVEGVGEGSGSSVTAIRLSAAAIFRVSKGEVPVNVGKSEPGPSSGGILKGKDVGVNIPIESEVVVEKVVVVELLIVVLDVERIVLDTVGCSNVGSGRVVVV